MFMNDPSAVTEPPIPRAPASEQFIDLVRVVSISDWIFRFPYAIAFSISDDASK
jgi:hypothetical protein